MWGLDNLKQFAGNALEKVQKAAQDLEAKMDNAVGVEESDRTVNAPMSSTMPSMDVQTSNSSSKTQESSADSMKTGLGVRSPEEIDLERRMVELKKDYNEACSRIQQLVDSEKNKDIALSSVQAKNIELQEALTKANQDRANEEEAVAERFKRDTEEMKQAFDNLVAERDNALEYTQKKHSLELGASQTEVERLTTQLKIAQTAAKKEAEKAASTDANIDASIQAQEELKEKILEIESLNEEAARLRTTCSASEVKVVNLEGALKSAISRTNTTQNRLDEAKKQLEVEMARCVELQNTVDAIKEEALMSRSQMETQQKEYESEREKLERRLAEKDEELRTKNEMLRAAQSSNVEGAELARSAVRLKEQLEEKQKQLAAFEHEGQALAKKQSEMEKAVRKAKSDLREKDKETTKLNERIAQLSKTIEETQEALRKYENEASSASKSLSAMQAVSQASTDKMTKLEAEVKQKTEEIVSQKKALESAWMETKDLKKCTIELRAERDDLQRRVGEGNSLAKETETYRLDSERREAVLQATTKQLEESLNRHMQESAAREERLREETYEMRRKWQEAVSAREALSSEMGNTTAPLLRQVAGLQDVLRQRTEGWQQLEANLTEKNMRSETALEKAKEQITIMETTLEDVRRSMEQTANQLISSEQQVVDAERLRSRLETEMSTLRDKTKKLDSRLALEVAERSGFENSIRDLEARLAAEEEKTQQALEQVKQVSESARIESEKALNSMSIHTGHGRDQGDSRDVEEENKTSSLSTRVLPDHLPGGEASYAARERMVQKNKRKTEDATEQLALIRQLEVARDSLLEEVNYLSERNAELEESVENMDSLKAEIAHQAQTLDTLLTLLGEKEEVLEFTIEDMKEVKTLYHDEKERLIAKVLGRSKSEDGVIEDNESKDVNVIVGGEDAGEDEA